jgi:hypothetical protein
VWGEWVFVSGIHQLPVRIFSLTFIPSFRGMNVIFVTARVPG